MQERFYIKYKNLSIEADEEYLYCNIHDIFKFKIASEFVLNIITRAYNGIQVQKKRR